MAEYYKTDSELSVVTDNVEIDYLKFNNMRHTILGCMLGDFDESGVYHVSPEIVKELIAMKKYIVNTDESIDICHSALKLEKQITFFVSYESDRATLSLVEKIYFQANHSLNSGLYSNVNEYVLDTVETSGVVNRNEIYRMWNISDEPCDILDVFKMDEATLAEMFGLVNRFKYLLAANKMLLDLEEKTDELEAEYAEGLFDVLSRFPKLKEAVEKDLNAVLKEGRGLLRLDKPNFAKTINEILIQSIDSHIDELTEDEKKAFETEKHNLTNDHNHKMSQVVEISKVQDKEDDKSYTLIKLDTKGQELLSLEEVAQRYIESKRTVDERLTKDVLGFIDNKGIGVFRSLLARRILKMSQTDIVQYVVDYIRDQVLSKRVNAEVEASVGTKKSQGLVGERAKKKSEKKKDKNANKKATKKKNSTKQKTNNNGTSQTTSGGTTQVYHYRNVTSGQDENNTTDKLQQAVSSNDGNVRETTKDKTNKFQVGQAREVLFSIGKRKISYNQIAETERKVDGSASNDNIFGV